MTKTYPMPRTASDAPRTPEAAVGHGPASQAPTHGRPDDGQRRMLEPLVRTLARREARRLHRGLGFGLPAVGLVMIAMAVVLAVLMLALGGRLSLGW